MVDGLPLPDAMMPAMRGRRNARRWAFVATGSVVWIALTILLAWYAAARRGAGSPLGRTLELIGAGTRTIEADLPRGSLVPGDRVLRLDGRRFRPCGAVRSVDRPVGGATVRIDLFPDAGLPDPLPPGTRLLLLDDRGTLEWALARVLSPERRDRLQAQFRQMVVEREGWLRQAFGPVLKEFARGVVSDVTTELTAFVRTHQDELCSVGEDLLARARVRWEPLLRELLWPEALARLEPIGNRVGEELWAALPWGELAGAVGEQLGGSLANIVIPRAYELPTDQLRKWRDGFLRDTALPIVRRHLPEALAAVYDSVAKAAEDPRVQDALRASFFEDGLGNPRVIRLLSDAFAAAVLANPRLRDRLQRLLDDPRVQRGLFDLAEQLEPRLIALAKSFLLDDEGRSLHPELAMLVRVRLIGSEGNWVLLELPAATGPATTTATTTTTTTAGTAGKARLQIVPFAGSTTETWDRPL